MYILFDLRKIHSERIVQINKTVLQLLVIIAYINYILPTILAFENLLSHLILYNVGHIFIFVYVTKI